MAGSWLAPLYGRMAVLPRNEIGMKRSLAALKDVAEHEVDRPRVEP
jgi:hypothetical protein